MDTVLRAGRAASVRKKAFRAADAFVVEAWKACRRMSGDDSETLAGSIRSRIGGAGAALVAASSAEPGGSVEGRRLGDARERLLQARYLLYLARRLGALDLASYRRLTAAHEAADRDLAAWAGAEGSG